VYGTKRNVPDYVINGGTAYRIISDWLGSVRLVLNATTGAVAQQIDYDELGNVQTGTYYDQSCALTAQCFPFQPFGVRQLLLKLCPLAVAVAALINSGVIDL
jgi:hypothetical protein